MTVLDANLLLLSSGEPVGLPWQTVGACLRISTNAPLSTLTVQCGGVLFSTDRDFTRFPGLRWRILSPLRPAAKNIGADLGSAYHTLHMCGLTIGWPSLQENAL